MYWKIYDNSPHFKAPVRRMSNKEEKRMHQWLLKNIKGEWCGPVKDKSSAEESWFGIMTYQYEYRFREEEDLMLYQLTWM